MAGLLLNVLPRPVKAVWVPLPGKIVEVFEKLLCSLDRRRINVWMTHPRTLLNVRCSIGDEWIEMLKEHRLPFASIYALLLGFDLSDACGPL